MDKKKSILNIVVSMATKIMTMITVIVVKRFLIQYCGNDANGLNALYLSIIGFLTVAELGIGTAITFCMYKPIIEGNNEQVAALYQLFRKLYFGIAGFIFTTGCLILPVLPQLAKSYASIDINLYETFMLMLISVTITYLFGAKTALINAYRYNYITTTINSAGMLIQYATQIAVLVCFRSYTLYLICRIVSAILQWIVTELYVRRNFRHILQLRSEVDKATKKTLLRNLKAMFMHKIGWVLSEQSGNVIVSTFAGVSVLGAYSNYTTIIFSVRSLVKLMFTPLISSFGHLYAKSSKDTTRECFEFFHLIAYTAGVVCYIGGYAIIDNFVSLFFLPELVMDRDIVFLIVLGGFIRYMRDYMDAFRDATGTFYNDRWKPMLEGCCNIILSIVLIQRIGIIGVLLASVITDLLISYVVEPFVLYRYAFNSKPWQYFSQNYGGILVFSLAMLIMDCCMVDTGNYLKNLLLNGVLSVGISSVSCVFVIALNWKKCADLIAVMKSKD